MKTYELQNRTGLDDPTRTERPWTGKGFGFEEARAAYDYLSSGAHTGKVTLRS